MVWEIYVSLGIPVVGEVDIAPVEYNKVKKSGLTRSGQSGRDQGQAAVASESVEREIGMSSFSPMEPIEDGCFLWLYRHVGLSMHVSFVMPVDICLSDPTPYCARDYTVKNKISCVVHFFQPFFEYSANFPVIQTQWHIYRL